MVTTDLLHHDDTLDLDSAALERALSDLWQQAAAGTDGSMPVARARVMTLVVYTEDEASAQLASAVAEALPERHPSRGIVVNVDPGHDHPPRAGISIQCLVNPGGERKVCSEQITVTAGGNSRHLLFGAITPLLVADLPATFWWTGRPRPADPVFQQFARGAMDRMLVDSHLFRDPGAGLIALARWKEDRRRRAAIGDLAWERLREWRQILAQTMDPPDSRAHLRSIVDVTISHQEGTIPEECLLLSGWLAAALRWQPFDSPAHGVVTFGAGERTVTLRLRPVNGERTVASIHAIRLVASDGAEYIVRADEQAGLGACVATTEGKEPLARIVPLGDRDPVDLVVRALGRRGPDPVYEAALSSAADFIVLGVTA